MKYAFIVFALVLSGCVTNRTCQLRTQQAVGKTLTDDVETTKLATEWQAAYDKQVFESIYCQMLIREEVRIASLSNSTQIRLPQFCGKFLKVPKSK